jgi:hypothetical protein
MTTRMKTFRSKCRDCLGKKKIRYEFDDGYIVKWCLKCTPDAPKEPLEVIENIDYWKFENLLQLGIYKH